MAALGWSHNGWPPAVKRNESGEVIADHGDNTWVNDVQACCLRVEREMILAELERRETQR